jgi:rare lipoprotein A
MMVRLLVLAVVSALAAACAGPRATVRPVPAIVGVDEQGLASWYGEPHHGRRTASGEVYDMHAMTAAHRTLPFGTWLSVENLDNGRTTRVRVNDRGPFVDGRIIDLSRAAGVALGMVGPGVVRVRLRVAGAPATAPAAYVVQVGAFSAEAGAAALHRTLAQAGFAVEVVRVDPGGEAPYRVRAGRFPTRVDAETQADRLTRAGYRAIVVTD